MGKLDDVLNVFKKRPINFIESYKEEEDIYTFVFEKPEDMNWKAGQHGLYDITHKKIKNRTRPFSIPTVPQENTIHITTRICREPSEFKQALLELKAGMSIRLTGPVGSFYLKESVPSVLIARGIGITPFRSMLKQLEVERQISTPIELLYLSRSKNYLFKEELDQLKKFDNLTLRFLDSDERLIKELGNFIGQYQNEANYFIAGPTSFVKSVSLYLKDSNIKKKQLKTDDFYGYKN